MEKESSKNVIEMEKWRKKLVEMEKEVKRVDVRIKMER